MRAVHLTIHDVLIVFRRRRRLFLFAVTCVTVLCTLTAFLLPRKYESSTTILVQRDEILNPLVSFSMAVTMASEDRLRTFNEIIYSQTTIQMLIDSLKLASGRDTEEERQALIKEVPKRIETMRRGSDSFRITFFDTDPVRAQRGVRVLANHFIKTILALENQRNETAVEFFEKKLEDLRAKFVENQEAVVNTLKERIHEMPLESRALYTNIEDTEREIQKVHGRLKDLQEGLRTLRAFPEAINASEGKKMLLGLVRQDLPYVSELRALVVRYEELTRRYTANYPEVKKQTYQILDMLATMRATIEEEIPKRRNELWILEKRRAQNVEDLKRSTVLQRVDEDKLSNYDIFRKLYDEMKIKLEQARTTRDLGRKGGEQFTIIDPPLIPTEPSKPNRLLIILGGFVLGIVIGVLSIGISEILDRTIRSPRDVRVYRKPTIAFLPEGTIPSAH
ncbi:MAG TPA: Wzz/FepE/Etk N-terminal domain-containing protein [Bacteroidota bacterium]|nr:Wzz/FepE/Etk N-terminal domain-containing protein [Bacteroidota bacterium]